MTDTLMDRMTNEIPLPEQWQVTKLGDVVLEHKSGIYKKRELFGTGHNIVGVSDLYENTSIDRQTFNLVPLTEDELDEFTLKEGDLIYGESSLVKEGIARTLYVSKNGEGTAFAWHTRKFAVDSNRVNSKFLNYLLNSWPIRRKIVSVSTQTALTGITTKEFFDVKIPLPPLPEQRKIAEILSTVDTTIEKTDAVIEETQQLKKGLMKKLFTGGIGHTRFKEWGKPRLRGSRVQISSIGELPESWQVQKIGEIARDKKGAIKIGPFGSQLKKEGMVDSGILVFGQENVFTKDFKMGTYFISPEKFEALKSVEIFPGDIVLTMMGTIGDCCVIPEEIDRGIMDSHLMRIQVREHVNPYFIARLIRDSYTVKKQVECLSQGAIMSGLNLTLVKGIFLPIPPIEEQNRIEEILSEVDTRIETEQVFKTELEQLKKGLMQVLLTGEVRVKV